MKYNKVQCPVCGEVFTDESDVVVCPECGTPHHRECYFKIGRCANERLHAENFVWSSPLVAAAVSEKKAEAFQDKSETSFGRKSSDTSKPLEKKENENGVVPELEFDKTGMPKPVFRTVSGKEKIGQFTVEEYAAVVQKKKHKFCPKFLIMEKTGRKFSWNWAAFFFGPYWLFYRKMYKYGAIALLIVAAVQLIFVGDIMNYTNEVVSKYAEFVESINQNQEMTQAEAQQAVLDMYDKLPETPPALTAYYYVQFVVKMLLAVFGNYLYKTHCTKLLQDVRKKEPDKIKAAELIGKKGGCSIVAVILSFAVLFLLSYVATYVYTTRGIDIATILRRYI